ncbi:ABC-type transporter Mla subunit MlaD [Microbacterium resistens]|uniref:ABC-type transporter Mla subunit MlaD n=1 Tax=Microbacterium resistens TaxID=156977 RepID=A0ABU1SDB5_9MICO|nr:ABC-type transporter Mla subunit MlaD [Microbacterium resistens]
MDLVALELFFVGLLGLAGLAIAFCAGVVLVNLFRGQR